MNKQPLSDERLEQLANIAYCLSQVDDVLRHWLNMESSVASKMISDLAAIISESFGFPIDSLEADKILEAVMYYGHAGKRVLWEIRNPGEQYGVVSKNEVDRRTAEMKGKLPIADPVCFRHINIREKFYWPLNEDAVIWKKLNDNTAIANGYAASDGFNLEELVIPVPQKDSENQTHSGPESGLPEETPDCDSGTDASSSVASPE